MPQGKTWELDGNKEKEKKKKNSPHPTPPTKGKKEGPSGVHGEPFHWLHEFSHSKTVGHH